MRVAVLGASGGTGRIVVRGALERGHQVVAVTRDPASLRGRLPVGPGSSSARLDVRTCDVHDLASVQSAVMGCEVVLSVIAPPLHRHLIRSTNLYSMGGRNLVRAVADQNVRRLIVVSTAGVLDADPSHPPFYRLVLKPLLFDRALYRDARVMEQVVEGSGPEWIIVRASGLTNGPETKKYRVELGQLPSRGSRVSRADLAYFLLEQLEDDQYVGRHPTIAY